MSRELARRLSIGSTSLADFVGLPLWLMLTVVLSGFLAALFGLSQKGR